MNEDHPLGGDGPGRRVPEDIRELTRFFETFQIPEDADWTTYLRDTDARMNAVAVPVPEPTVVVLHEVAGWAVRAAIWAPEGAGPHPVVLHLHGGSWTAGNHLTQRGFDAELVAAGFLAVSLDYRRAPRHHFPAALDDARAALSWCAEHIAEHHGDPSRIAVVGDSAGANLAAAVLAADDAGLARAGGFLFGIYDYHRVLEVLGTLTGGTEYVAPGDLEATRGDPRLSPYHAAGRLPLSYLAVGGLDPLLTEARLMRDALLEHGVPHVYHEIPQAPHSYIQLPGHPDYAEGISGVTSFLTYALRGDEGALASFGADALNGLRPGG